MVKHIILWKLKDDISSTEKTEIKKNAKKALEDLKGKIDGLKSNEKERHRLRFVSN